jgi:hypothetical protein
MATKSKKDFNDPLSIWNEMIAVDKKDYDYYDRLTDDQKKQFSPYLIMRWSSTVEGNNDIAKYYAVATNEFANTNFFDLSKHKKLQWLSICAISPNIGKQKHYWLGAAKGKGSSALKNILMERLPNTKENDIDLILQTNSKEEIKEWLRQWGMEEKELKKFA